VTAGAGLGKDSGLPVFRGEKDLWDHYPFFAKAGMTFSDAASPKFLAREPERFWYFYGHRYNKYLETEPHKGFQAMREMAETFSDARLTTTSKENYFVYTSNVDGHFQKAGFNTNKIVECHGSINHFQCDYCGEIFDAPAKEIPLDQEKHVVREMPSCPLCPPEQDCTVRPNILMFNDL